MKTYRQPKAGTPDAMKKDVTKLVNNDSKPSYQYRQNIIESIKYWCKNGDTSNYEWQ